MNAGSAVMLEGPVGSGKTSLVECLAASVGRTSSPHLLKLQLGDQMDSKVFLLSTDMLTEFIVNAAYWLCAVQ